MKEKENWLGFEKAVSLYYAGKTNEVGYNPSLSLEKRSLLLRDSLGAVAEEYLDQIQKIQNELSQAHRNWHEFENFEEFKKNIQEILKRTYPQLTENTISLFCNWFGYQWR